MLGIYKQLMRRAAPALGWVLKTREAAGKEDPARVGERQGIPGRARPPGPLLWIHAASVGEAQSALILVDALLKAKPDASILVTTGTVTSAALMAQRLPGPRAFHQYIPVDHPQWTARFLDYWTPDAAFWMESELWPNILSGIRARNIPAALINARMSDRSYARWKWLSGAAGELVSTFDIILTQTDKDAKRYSALGGKNVTVTDNLKYSAEMLPADDMELRRLKSFRPKWVYASTHAGEESLACRVHAALKNKIPGLLTIIIPRHPHRRAEVVAEVEKSGLSYTLRTDAHHPPRETDDVYIVDTLGELGLFYRLSPVAMIGRSFSADGGGGHNPIEAAQLNCAILTGPHVQFQQDIFTTLFNAGAAEQVMDENDLTHAIHSLLTHEHECRALQKNALMLAAQKTGVMARVMAGLSPMLQAIGKSHAA